MFPHQMRYAKRLECLPRSRGDVPKTHGSRLMRFVSAPLTRGCSGVFHVVAKAVEVCPAHAGMFLLSRVLIEL